MSSSDQSRNAAADQAAALPRASRFRLIPYFFATSIVAFFLFAAVIVYFERLERDTFHRGQQEQSEFFAQLQDGFVQRHDSAANAYLLRVYEAGNVNLARLFSNTLWERDFAPFVARAQRIPVDQCRAMADAKDAGGKTGPTREKQDCYAGIGRSIMALPEFRRLDATVRNTMKKTSVFKIKVFDRRGITVYSSEHSQLGEDRLGTAAWESALAGKPMSQLSFRGKFMTFEGVVTDRDLVSSYMPVHHPRSGDIVAVFEVYSDVTQFLAQIKTTSAEIRKLIAANQAQFEQAAAASREKMESSAATLLRGTFVALALLYLVLYLIVLNAQRIIDRHESGRRRLEAELTRQRDLYGMLSHTNKAIVRMADREDLFASVCRAAVEHGRFEFAWIGLRGKSGPRVTVAARYGDDTGYIDRVLVSADASDPRGRGPTGQALRAGERAVANDFLNDPATSPWHEAARLAGVRASGAFPIREGGEVIGALCVYADVPGFFSASLIATLDEIAMDISFALDNFAREAARQQSEARFRSLFENMLNGFAYCKMQFDDHDRPVDFVYLDVNAAFERLTGLKNVVGRNVTEVIPGIREANPELLEAYGRVASTGIPETFEIDVKPLARWFSVSAYGPEKGCFVAVFDDITERKQSEQALRESDARTQLLVKSSNIGLFDWNLLTNEVYYSPQWKQHLGYADQELPNRYEEWESRLHPEDREQTLAAVTDFRDGRRADYDVEFRLRHKDGSWRWILTRADLIRDAAGQPLRMMGCHIDITERKRALEALQASEKKYRRIFDSLQDVYIETDPGGIIREISAEVATLSKSQYRREDLLGKRAGDLYADPQRRDALLQALKQHGRVIDFEADLRNRDGSIVPCSVSATLEIDADGTQAGMSATVRDISERKRAERELADANVQFQAMVEQSIAGILIIQDRKLAYVNPRFCEIHGYASQRELLGIDPLSLIVENDRPAATDAIRRLLDGKLNHISYTLTALRKDGATVEVGLSSARASYLGRPAIIAMLQDISEKKRAEEQIQHYVAQLERAFMSTVEVATTIGEMRDPYTAGHERRVAEVAVAIGGELGFDDRRLEGLKVAGYLHDLGKITIPSEILSKPGKLSPVEFRLIQGHPQASYDVLKGVDFPWPVAQVALQHHERMNGSGYPQGLKGEAILLDARILAVADVVEAMSSHRPYRPGLGIDKALAEIERGRGSAYDPEVADACLRLFREKGYAIPA